MTHLDLTKKAAQLRAGIPRLTRLIAQDSVNFFVRSFNIQGFEDVSVSRWPSRRGEIRGGIARVSRRSSGSRAILIRSGDLKRSVRIRRLYSSSGVIGSDLVYAAIHNFGLDGRAYGKYPFRMPQRKFIGVSRKLNRLSLLRIKAHVKYIFGKAAR